MTFEVRITGPASKALEDLPRDVSDRVRMAMRALVTEPRRRRPGADIKRLQGEPGVFRLRVGDYRVFYVIYPDESVVYVTSILHRSRAYD